MNFLKKPVVILINVAIAAVVGAFAYNFKHKAAVASEYLDGIFGGLTKSAMEKNSSNGNICIVLALLFLGFAIVGIVLFSKYKNAQVEKNQSKI